MHLLDETKHLLSEHNILPKRSLGQSFCVDDNLLKRMISYSDISENDIVLEIGSGFGFLTRYLSEVAKRVIAIELDSKIIDIMKRNLKDRKNIMAIQGNILEVKLPKFNKIVANPPYSISSSLMMLLFNIKFDRAVLTLQKEFTEKLIAKVGTRNYGPLAVLAYYKMHVRILEKLSQELFYPQPKIESNVVLIETCKPKFTVTDEKLFFKIVEYLFTQRNRKVRRPLESFLLKEISIDKIEARMIAKSIPFTETRVCNLDPENFAELSNKLFIFLKSKIAIFKNHKFYVFPEIYAPAEDTFLIAENLDVEEGKKVLDMGTGCGLLGIVAAEKAESVIAVDINPQAPKAVRFNAKLNNVADRVDAIESDMFEGFKADTKFDFIIFNPPYLPSEEIAPKKWLEKAWQGGKLGREIINNFLNNVDKHVTKGGRVLLIQSSLSNPEESVKMLSEKGFKIEVLAHEDLFFEKLMVIRAIKEK